MKISSIPLPRAAWLLAVGAIPLLATAAPLRFAEDQAPAIVNPLFGSTMSEARVNELIFASLYRDDRELVSAPQLVESAELSPDRLTLRLTLRSDVVWQDNQPLTAQDVVFTIEAMKNPENASPEASRVAFITRATAEGERTVALQFARPEIKPEDKLQFKILPAHAFASSTVRRSDPFHRAPIGVGPYRLTRFNDDSSISFQAATGPLGGGGVPQLTLKEVSDKNYQAKLLQYESLEALVKVMPRDVPVLQNNKKVDLYPYQTNSWWYVGFNTQQAPFNSPAVRAAFNQIVDVNALLAPIGTGERVSGPFVPSSPYYNHSVALTPSNPTAGVAALQAAGLAQSGRQWTWKGAPLTLTITAHKSLESAQEVAINLQSQLQSAGFSVQLEFLDDAAWKSRVWRDKDFQIVLSQWTFDRTEDIREQFATNGNRNFLRYSNPKVDALFDTAATTSDPFARRNALREVHALVTADHPMIFLWTLDNYAAFSTKVKNVVIHPFYFFTFVKDWQFK